MATAAANKTIVAPPCAPQASDPMPVIGAETLAELAVKNPAPDSSPSREPTGTYRIISCD